MKRFLTFVLGGVLTLAVALGLALYWLFGTTSGAGWLLDAVSRWTPASVSAKRVEGSLAAGLHLQELRASWPKGHAGVGQLRLQWRPVGLFVGRLEIDAVKVSKIEVNLPSGEEKPTQPGEPFLPAWPRISGWPLHWAAEIKRLDVEDLVLRPAEGDPVTIHRIGMRLSWEKGFLTVSALEAATSMGEGRADLRLGLADPELRLRAEAALAEPLAGLNRFALKGDLGRPDASGAAPGRLLVESFAGDRPRYRLEAALTLLKNKLRIASMALTQRDRPGRIDVKGDLTLKGDPQLQLEAHIAGVNLVEETGTTTELHGRGQISGLLSDFQGSFHLANRVPGWQHAALTAQVAGSPAGIRVTDLRGNWLQGEIGGDLSLGWAEGFEALGELRCRGLNPGVAHADWPGQVNLDLEGGLKISADQPFSATVRARLFDSRLRQKALTGAADAQISGDELNLEKLQLHGDGFDLAAAGRLSERLAVQADIHNLAALIPDSKGRIAAKGWLRWKDSYLSGDVDGLVRALAFQGLDVDKLDLALSHPKKDGPIRLAARGQTLGFREYRFTSMDLAVSGSLVSHQGRLDLLWPEGRAWVEARGGYREERWSGSLVKGRGEDPRFGTWEMEDPAGLIVAARRLVVENLVLASRQKERVHAEADLFFQPLRGKVRASAEKLDLAKANPWLKEMRADGSASGAVDVAWLPSGGVELAGMIDFYIRLTQGEDKLEIDRGHGNIRWNGQGLRAGLNLQMPHGQGLQADIVSAQPARLDLPEEAEFVLDWKGLPLQLLQSLLPDTRLKGSCDGKIQGRWLASGDLKVEGRVETDARMTRNNLTLAISRARSDFRWNPSGLKADLDVEMEKGGSFSARFSSPEPGRLKLPGQGVFEANWKALDLVPAQPFLPQGLTLSGYLSGEARGRWLPGQRWEMTGRSGIAEGELAWSEESEGKISAAVKEGQLNWVWKDHWFQGEARLALSDYGRIEGTCRLPLPASLPMAFEPQGSLQARLAGRLEEKGLVATLLPGVVEESRGALDFDLTAAGSWRNPRLGGGLKLAGAGGYLPAAGIRLEKVRLEAELSNDRFHITSFQLHSGPGQLSGDAEVRFEDRRISGYRATIKGERFQLVNLPELQMQVKPDLRVEGDLGRLMVRGEVLLPEVLIAGKQGRTPVERSQDVVLVDADKPVDKPMPLDLDIRLHVELGDHVLLKVAGIDARLNGALNLTATSPTNVTAQGEIKVVKGSYSAYGVKLNVTRGRILFAGGPIDRPTLDILALRTIDDIQAGVRVSGTPRTPVVKLFSEPGMPDTDILSYIVLGHPIGADSSQAGMLMTAAGALLSQGESTVLQDRLQRRLGLDVVDIQAGSGNVESSMVTIGKYLTPELYISIGQGLLNNAREFRMRYSLTKNWEVESNVGVESGADLYYKIEFQ